MALCCHDMIVTALGTLFVGRVILAVLEGQRIK